MLAEARWLGGKGSSLIVISLYGLIIGIVLFGSAWGGYSRPLQTSPDLSPDLARRKEGLPPRGQRPRFRCLFQKKTPKTGSLAFGKENKEGKKEGRKEGHGLAFISSFYEV